MYKHPCRYFGILEVNVECLLIKLITSPVRQSNLSSNCEEQYKTMQNYMFVFAQARRVLILLVLSWDIRRLVEWECVCRRSEPVEVTYKGPPQLCRQTGNCCAFSQFHMAPSVSSALPCIFLALSNKPNASCFCRLLTLCTILTTTSFQSLPLLPTSAPYSLLLVPGWASPLD